MKRGGSSKSELESEHAGVGAGQAKRGAAPLIARKITVPSLSDDVIERGRLRDLVVEAIERHRVVQVAATAGAGKTTAVVAAVRGLDRRVAWLTVDRSDTAPGRLLTYVEAP